MDPTVALWRLGGAARPRELYKLGVTERAVRTALNAATVLRPRTGVLALPDASAHVTMAAAFGAQLTCVSAFAHIGLPLRMPAAEAHIAVHQSFTLRGRDPQGARIHYQQSPLAPGRFAAVAAALDAAGSCVDPVWHLVAVDAALQRGLISLGDVLDFRKTRKERRDWLLRYADARSQAPGETIVRQRLVAAGHAVCPQAYVEGAGFVDLEVDGLLLLEIDGYGPHSGKSAFRKDRERGRAFVKAGRPALSYAASEVLGEWTPDVEKDVRDAIAAWRSRGRLRISPS